MKQCLVVVGLALVLLATARAERPPQPRNKADLVVTGTVGKIKTTESKFGGDGISTTYVAEVKLDKVEKGEGAKAGATISVTWFRVTRAPSRPLAGAYGQDHALKEKDRARFWLMRGQGPWQIIYNRDGVEKVKEKGGP